VLSVGNITLGGTGKTILVEFIAKYLRQNGHNVAILTRGYKRKTSNFKLQTSNYETMGDEPYMLFKKLGDTPIIVEADRIRGAKKAIKEHCADTVILDDGFQQWRIFKDLEIVAIDTTNPFGNRHMIPRGILREPLSSLKRADIFMLTKTNLNNKIADLKFILNRLNPKATIIESSHEPIGFYYYGRPDELFNINALKGKTVSLFSGIGDPDSFENLIKSLGINIGLSLIFNDHHSYTQEDLDKIIRGSKERGIDTVITTEKDVVRLYELRVTSYELRILILRIELKVAKNEDEFRNRLLKLYSL
jgi:tetraacyldisaccharide 4'-kinase